MKATRLLALLFLLAFASSVPGKDAAEKRPVPLDAAQAEATKLVKEVYGDEYAKAKTFELKQALGKKLLQKGIETEKDDAARFVASSPGCHATSPPKPQMGRPRFRQSTRWRNASRSTLWK